MNAFKHRQPQLGPLHRGAINGEKPSDTLHHLSRKRAALLCNSLCLDHMLLPVSASHVTGLNANTAAAMVGSPATGME
jgi:hypothetical protein